MGSSLNRLLVPHPDGQEALIAKCIPKDIARWQPHGWHEVVSERRLLACREAHYVHGRVPAVLFARLGIHYGLAEPFMAMAPDYPSGGLCSRGSKLLGMGGFDRWCGFRQCRSRVGGIGTGTRANGKGAHPNYGSNG